MRYVNDRKCCKLNIRSHSLDRTFRWSYVLHHVQTSEKEQKRVAAMLSSMEVGDVVVTTSGFYGVLIDITDDDVIVEFGSNRNCRIPMKKAAIQQVEKQD